MKDTKDRILAEGLNLLTRTGFGNVTVGLLAQRTGLSKSGLFAHFGSKEQVQLELLEKANQLAAKSVIGPALELAPGLERLRAVVQRWIGWTEKAGLEGGCPITAGLFEYDDAPAEDPVRQRLLAMEEGWRMFLVLTTREAVEAGQLRSDLDLDQFVWELCSFYLNRHVSHRFLHDPQADARAQEAFEGLVMRSRPDRRSEALKTRTNPKPSRSKQKEK